MSDEAKNVELLRQAYDRWHSSKGQTADHWMDLLADNVEFKSLAEGAQGMEFTTMRRSRREVGAYFEGLAKDWEMHYYRIDEYVAQGNCVVAIGECSFRHRRNGNDLVTPKVDIWHFDKGKVVRFFELYDTANVLAAARG